MRAIPNLPWTALPPTLGVSGKPGQLQLASMTRHGPVTTQDETTQHGCQVAPTPAAPVGSAIPPPTTHPGSIVQLRERLSPGEQTRLDGTTHALGQLQ